MYLSSLDLTVSLEETLQLQSVLTFYSFANLEGLKNELNSFKKANYSGLAYYTITELFDPFLSLFFSSYCSPVVRLHMSH